MKKTLIIGLDGADPELVFEKLKGTLPNIEMIISNGKHGKILSCYPPITVPAWSVMFTGQDPGQLGVYGFKNRIRGTYSDGMIVKSSSITYPRVWDTLNKKSVIIGVPPLHPVYPINGTMVGCFLTPSSDSSLGFYPPTLKEQYELHNYKFDVSTYRTENKAKLLNELIDMTHARFKLAKKLLNEKEWELFILIEIGTDRLHHGFWNFFDSSHRNYIEDSEFINVIPNYYKLVDSYIGELLNLLDSDTSLLIVSDHGVRRLDGMICLNDWLLQEGYLKLNKMPSKPTDIDKCDVNWKETIAWASGGYYGRIYINQQGREPQGIVNHYETEIYCNEIKEKLQKICNDQGRSMDTKVFKPKELYKNTNGLPPDLLVFFDDLYWRVSGKIGNKSFLLTENDRGPDSANHSQYGLFIASGEISNQFSENEEVDIAEIYNKIINHMI